jgi:hypothetical protein
MKASWVWTDIGGAAVSLNVTSKNCHVLFATFINFCLEKLLGF